jgi:hypothetical protein
VFSVETLSQEPATAIAIVVFLLLSVGADWFWRSIPSLRGQVTASKASPDLAPTPDF